EILSGREEEWGICIDDIKARLAVDGYRGGERIRIVDRDLIFAGATIDDHSSREGGVDMNDVGCRASIQRERLDALIKRGAVRSAAEGGGRNVVRVACGDGLIVDEQGVDSRIAVDGDVGARFERVDIDDVVAGVGFQNDVLYEQELKTGSSA